MSAPTDVRAEWRPAVVKTLATFDGPAPLHWLLERLLTLGLEGGKAWAHRAVLEAVYSGELEALRPDGSVVAGFVVLSAATMLQLPKSRGRKVKKGGRLERQMIADAAAKAVANVERETE